MATVNTSEPPNQLSDLFPGASLSLPEWVGKKLANSFSLKMKRRRLNGSL